MKRIIFGLHLLTILFFVSCQKHKLAKTGRDGTITQRSLTSRTKKVLIIGIDGCRQDVLMSSNTPNIKSLRSHAVYSLDALTESPTWSGNGWSTMLTGVTHLKHNVTDNSFSNPNFNSYPNFLKRVEAYDPAKRTISVAHWAPINTYIMSGIDVERTFTTDLQVKNDVVDILNTDNPDVLFMQFDDVDHAGHSYGFSSSVPQYVSAIEATDVYVGQILTALRNRANYANEDWLVVVSTDHGGVGTSHGGSSYTERNIFTFFHNESFAETKIEKPAPSATSLTGTFASFNATNKYASSNNTLYNFGTSGFTIECRVKTSGYTSDPALVSNKNWASGMNRGYVICANTGGAWKVNLGDTKKRIDINGGVINDGKWHHLVMVVDRSAQLVKIYQDGSFAGQASIPSGFGSLTSGLPMVIGQDGTKAYPAHVNGSISEVRVWNKALSQNTILNNCCSGVTAAHPDYLSLIGYWKGNDGSGSIFADFSPYNVAMSFVNTPTWTTSTADLICGPAPTGNVPKMVDITYTSLSWLGVPVSASWGLDGQSWLP